MTLKQMIETASRFSEGAFAKAGEIRPMYHAIREDGAHLIIPAPITDKDTAVDMIKALFAIEKVASYVFMNEAWKLEMVEGFETEQLAEYNRTGVKDHPDRREIVMFIAENKQGERQTATRYILRPEGGKASLSPLKMDDMTEGTPGGRMIGLLQQEVKI